MKKFFVFLLSLTICLTPSLVFASAAPKWEIIENVYDKSKNLVEVTAKKITTDASNDGTYKVRVPVTAADLGSTVKSMLWLGVATAAVTGLVEGVGWIIDEGSKVIKKPVPDDGITCQTRDECKKYKYLYYDDYGIHSCNTAAGVGCSSSARQACTKSAASFPYYGKIISYPPDVGGVCELERLKIGIHRTTNNSHDPNESNEPKFTPVSDSQLGDLILGDSTEPNAPSVPQPAIITDAYNPNNPASDAPAPAAVGDALSDANPTPDSEKPPVGDSKPKPNVDTDGDGKPDAYDPNAPTEGNEFELPVFCSWAPAVCDFFKVQKQDNKEIKENQKEQIKQDASFIESVKDWFDWTKKDPENDNSDNDLSVTTPEPFDTSVFSKDRFKVSRQCPVPEQHTISLSGISVNFAFDLQPICSVLDLARPALIACSYLYACYIVIGAARNG